MHSACSRLVTVTPRTEGGGGWPAHPGHRVAIDHKQAVLERFAGLAREAELRDPGGLAAQLLLLMDGAWVAARMFGPGSHAASVADAARAIIEHHAASGSWLVA